MKERIQTFGALQAETNLIVCKTQTSLSLTRGIAAAGDCTYYIGKELPPLSENKKWHQIAKCTGASGRTVVMKPIYGIKGKNFNESKIKKYYKMVLRVCAAFHRE